MTLRPSFDTLTTLNSRPGKQLAHSPSVGRVHRAWGIGVMNLKYQHNIPDWAQRKGARDTTPTPLRAGFPRPPEKKAFSSHMRTTELTWRAHPSYARALVGPPGAVTSVLPEGF